MEGFTSFRDRTTVDFEGADLFVLTGATGAGKSSVIDAITFALYGTIPRLDDRRLVEPVISRGLARARVSLDFSVGDKRYRAVRVARATATGATTPEARLEDDAENTLAGSARELSDKVEEILGLSFEQFTRSVVLPQGDFAKLLHEKPSERQAMLRRLLGTELFRRLARRANERHTRANADIEAVEAELARRIAAGITPEGLDEARGRVTELEDLQVRIQDRRPQIEELGTRAREAGSRRAKLEERIARLADLRTPDGVPELAEKIRDAGRRREDATKEHSEAVLERGRLREELNGLPSEAELRLQLKRHDDLGKARQDRDEAANGTKVAEAVLEEARAEATAKEEGIAGAERARREMEDTHRAYHLAVALVEGEPCPVCRQDVSEVPHLEEPEGIAEAEAALDAAQRARTKAAKRLADAQSDVDRWRANFETSDRQAQELQEALPGDISRDALVASLERVTAADRALNQATTEEDHARSRLAAADAAVTALDEEQGRAWLAYNEQRDAVAEMRPPAAERSDLATAWAHLVTWAREQEEREQASLAESERERHTTEAALHGLERTVLQWCDDADVKVVDDEDPLTACSRMLGQQGEVVKRIEAELADLEQRRQAMDIRRQDAAVARGLADHLRADGFEGWLMAQVLEQLCVEASMQLRKLSNDSYSLSLNERNDFVVVDHHNADERRLVKTLSGGETFLASLSLALSLSSQLVDFAAGGAAKLEALFLDEGFGTLDPDTLDMVTDALEELGSDGKMVGVVTHVAELAEHMPVRFEVTKQGNRSSIERMEA